MAGFFSKLFGRRKKKDKKESSSDVKSDNKAPSSSTSSSGSTQKHDKKQEVAKSSSPSSTSAPAAVEDKKKSNKSESNKHSDTMTVEPHLVKYIIGTGGATIREIEEKCGSGTKLNVDSKSGQIEIVANDKKAIKEAKKLVQEVCKEHEHKVDKDSALSETYDIPERIHRYIIGPGGANIKEIQEKNGSRVEFNGEKCTISAHKKPAIEKTHKAILKVLAEHGWHYDKSKKTFYEINVVGEFAEKARKEADEAAAKRNKCFEESKRAFEAGDKAKAKELSEEGHAYDAKFRELQKKACKKIFEFVNKKNPANVIDLHGLLVDEALDIVRQKVDELKKSGKHSEMTVITGAGLHSDKSGPKIKPAVAKLMKEELKLKYSEVNHGEILATL